MKSSRFHFSQAWLTTLAVLSAIVPSGAMK
jgi:hypothetical protein